MFSAFYTGLASWRFSTEQEALMTIGSLQRLLVMMFAMGMGSASSTSVLSAGECGANVTDWVPASGSAAYTVLNSSAYSSFSVLKSGGGSTMTTVQFGQQSSMYYPVPTGLTISGSTIDPVTQRPANFTVVISLSSPVCAIGGSQVTSARAVTSSSSPGGSSTLAEGMALRSGVFN